MNNVTEVNENKKADGGDGSHCVFLLRVKVTPRVGVLEDVAVVGSGQTARYTACVSRFYTTFDF